ncbi:hypothetical protein ACFL6C_02340 [Myxococcota bacterium]
MSESEEEEEEDLVRTALPTLTFDEFWGWLQGHPNCILRAGTATTVIFDDDDFHWHFGMDQEGVCLIQVIRGKRFVGEMVLNPPEVAFVECRQGEQDEFLFDLLDEHHRLVCQLVLSHGYDDSGPPTTGRLTH